MQELCPGCRFSQVERSNDALLPLLLDVTKTAYFRYFKVNLFCDCPLWPEDGMCSMEACSVCECADSEVPPAWRQEDTHDCQILCAFTLSL
jgi:ERO1-like protein alpha